MNKLCLSPPWYTLRNQIACTFGDNPYVKVSVLGETSTNTYILSIYINDFICALSTKAILPSTYQFGNVIVEIHIFYKNKLLTNLPAIKISSSKDIAQLFNNALVHNNFLRKIILPEYTPYFKVPNVAIIIKKSIVQFFNDDISDIYSNYNEIASNVFNDICCLNFNDITVKFYTENCRCEL